MTEDQINAELTLIAQNISDQLQAGEEYETESSSSRRRTKWTSLEKLYNRQSYLYGLLDTMNGGGSTQLGF